MTAEPRRTKAVETGPAPVPLHRIYRPEPPATAAPLPPLAFEPILKSLIWGGRRLGTVLNKPTAGADRVAESWELADHRGDVSRVASGPHAGTTLRDLVRNRGEELLGPGRAGPGQFPLLVKFLDANDVLSVQVHPDDALGRLLVGDNGKTEAWVILHAEPGSLIYAGLRPGVTCKGFARAMAAGEVEPLLHRFEARAGDCVMVPAGTVHAIGAGVLLAEVQQSSDATFRVHDWGRVGPDGRPRALHPAESLAAIDFQSGPVAPVAVSPVPVAGGTAERLAECPYFALTRLRLSGPSTVGRPDRFTVLLGLGGEADVVHDGVPTRLGFGRTLLLPASAGACPIVPRGGGAVVLSCDVP